MTLYKWNSDGDLTWGSGELLESDDLNRTIDEVMPPIGAVLPWLKSFTGVPATLPTGWVECNGQVLSDADSPLNGQTIPNLNGSGGGTKRFLRGSTTSGTTAGEDTTAAHTHSLSWGSNNATTGAARHMPSGSSTESGGGHTNLPSYYEVVFILRIK